MSEQIEGSPRFGHGSAILADRVGFWSGVLSAVFAAISFALGVTTPPRTGPFAAPAIAIGYPYMQAAAFVARDFLWMWPAMLMMAAFLILAAATHHRAASNARLSSRIGLCLATISTAVIVGDYFVQLRAVQPSLLRGEVQGLALLSQYNPHGVFIALEEFGYIAMSVGMLFLAFSVPGTGRLEQSIRWIFFVSSVLTISSFIGMSVYFGFALEYRFEVAVITIDYLTLAISGVLLSRWFLRPSGVGT